MEDEDKKQLELDLGNLYVPTLDALQEIDAGNILTKDDLGLYMDEFIVQDLGGLF